ncbi:hypothetical protein [Paraburkholderia flagellata]|uniref:hypothetical protein n=1 Tax=Paraburkholderia flagellata TaxID=2883241 RepID=UPI001F242DCA|nr:hypothetical protein [Paraburkholderia flagellata]
MCGAWKTAFSDLDALDRRSMAGIQAAFGGICPSFGETVLSFSGEKDAVANALLAWQDAMENEGKLGKQSSTGEHVSFYEQEDS